MNDKAAATVSGMFPLANQQWIGLAVRKIAKDCKRDNLCQSSLQALRRFVLCVYTYHIILILQRLLYANLIIVGNWEGAFSSKKFLIVFLLY